MLATRKLHVHVFSRTESIPTELTVDIAVFGDAHSATFILVALVLGSHHYFTDVLYYVSTALVSATLVVNRVWEGWIVRITWAGMDMSMNTIILSHVAVSS